MGQGASVASWVDRSQAGQPQGKTPGKSQAAGPERMGTVGIQACEVCAVGASLWPLGPVGDGPMLLYIPSSSGEP